MAELTTIARPYAKAVFAHANATQAQSSWSAFLKKAASVTADSAMVEVLKNPAVTAETKCEILGDLTQDVTVDGVDALMEALAHYGRLLALPAISTEFETLLAQGQQALEVTITSAFLLEADEIQLLESKLKTRYAGKTIRVETAVDQSLIGGFEIRSSDTVIDATVRGRLSKIAESLTA
ncbi:MAG: F0F1 ATP synthase subunit delta [Litorivicinaceae bacterium]|jgi:F-type H+-transporting ATPase subunit delta|nr:F0F1 ATP synthase subunit delta [Gammaproteobacteria bacterium]